MYRLKETTKKDHSRRMLKVLSYIQQNLGEQVSLDELAGIACYSSYHFHRIFRGMVGESVKEYIRRLRLEHAASRLKNGNRQIVEIAFEAGYEAHESFTRAFGDLFGMSPQKYRHSQKALAKSSGKPFHYSNENLQQFNSAEEGETMQVKTVEFETVKVAFVRHCGAYNKCSTAWETLCTWAAPLGLLNPDSRFLGLCYDDPEITDPEKIRYDACITIDEDIEPEGMVAMQTISGGMYAVTTHFGPYDNLHKTYAQLCGQWVPEHGFEIASKPSIEMYLNSPEDTEPEELLTDIYVPLETR
jgi:AraC family transcriptional regulator